MHPWRVVISRVPDVCSIEDFCYLMAEHGSDGHTAFWMSGVSPIDNWVSFPLLFDSTTTQSAAVHLIAGGGLGSSDWVSHIQASTPIRTIQQSIVAPCTAEPSVLNGQRIFHGPHNANDFRIDVSVACPRGAQQHHSGCTSLQARFTALHDARPHRQASTLQAGRKDSRQRGLEGSETSNDTPALPPPPPPPPQSALRSMLFSWDLLAGAAELRPSRSPAARRGTLHPGARDANHVRRTLRAYSSPRHHVRALAQPRQTPTIHAQPQLRQNAEKASGTQREMCCQAAKSARD